MKFIRGHRLRSSVLFVGGSLLSIAASAQTAPPVAAPPATQEAIRAGESPSGTPTADIIVTAQRRSESLQKVPMSVSVATGEQLEKLNIFDFKDVQQLAPGLTLTNNDGRSNVATLRGITFNPDSGTNPAVDLFFNEIPVDAQTAFTAIYDVGQIEVLRGPQGIFRGRTSPAGSITIATRKPNMDDPEGYVEVTGTNRRAVNGQGAVSIPIVPGVLAIRAAGLVDFNRGNYVRSIPNNNRLSHSNTLSERLSIAFTPTPDFKATLTYQHLDSDVTPNIAVFGPGNTPFAPFPSDPRVTVTSGPALKPGDRRSVTEGLPRYQNRTHLVTLATDWDLGPASLSFNGGYQDTLLRQFRDLDSRNAVPGYIQAQNTRTPYIVWTGDLRLASHNAGFFNWMVGGYYTHQKNDVAVSQANDSFNVYPLPFFPPLSPGNLLFQTPVNVNIRIPIVLTTYAGFGSTRLQFTDKLKLEAGLRYTVYQVDRQSFLSVDANGAPVLTNFPTLSAKNANASYHALTGGATLSYQATPDINAYVAYGRAYRPGVSAVGVTAALPDSVLVTKPEHSDSVEIGVKTALLNRRVNLNISAFYQKYKDYIDHLDAVTVFDAATGGLTNAPLNTNGDATAKGVEAQLTARVNRFFDFGVSASYVDAHYKNAALFCNDYNGDGTPDTVGNPAVPAGQVVATCRTSRRVSQIPKFNLSANGEVHFGMGDLQPFVRTLITYRPGFKSSLDEYRYRDYTNINLYVGVRGKNDRWELTGFVKNLLNQARVIRTTTEGDQSTGLLDLATFAPTGAPGPALASGYRGGTVSLPRELGVTARFRW